MINIFAIAATFTLVLREWQPVKWADLFFALMIILVLWNYKIGQEFKPYIKALFLILFFTLIGQLFGFLNFGMTLPLKEMIINYGRIIFDGLIFIFLAFLVSREKKLFSQISTAVFVSPLILIPAWWGMWESFIHSGGRLAGFMQNPIILGSWLIISFLVGIGFFLDRKEWALKLSIGFGLFAIANFILWSASRAAWLSLLVGILIWIVFSFWQKKFSNAFVILFLSTGIFYIAYLSLSYFPVTERIGIQNTINIKALKLVTNPLEDQIRTEVWRQALPSSLRNFFGLGFGSYLGENVFPNPSSNTFLEISLFGGVGGLAAFIIIVQKLFLGIWPMLKNSIKKINVELAWFVAVPVILIDIFFTDGFFLRHVWVVLAIALGTSLRLKFKHFSDTMM